MVTYCLHDVCAVELCVHSVLLKCLLYMVHVWCVVCVWYEIVVDMLFVVYIWHGCDIYGVCGRYIYGVCMACLCRMCVVWCVMQVCHVLCVVYVWCVLPVVRLMFGLSVFFLCMWYMCYVSGVSMVYVSVEIYVVCGVFLLQGLYVWSLYVCGTCVVILWYMHHVCGMCVSCWQYVLWVLCMCECACGIDSVWCVLWCVCVVCYVYVINVCLIYTLFVWCICGIYGVSYMCSVRRVCVICEGHCMLHVLVIYVECVWCMCGVFVCGTCAMYVCYVYAWFVCHIWPVHVVGVVYVFCLWYKVYIRVVPVVYA